MNGSFIKNIRKLEYNMRFIELIMQKVLLA